MKADQFFDPIQHQELIALLRAKLEKLKIMIAVMEELKRDGVPGDLTETHRLAAQVEAQITHLEQRFSTVH
jgi:hypothetical protein